MFAALAGMEKDRRSGVDPEALARRAFGMAPTDERDPPVIDGVMAAHPRPCVGCGEPTARIVFEVESMCPRPAWCEACEQAAWDVAVELVGRDEPA